MICCEWIWEKPMTDNELAAAYLRRLRHAARRLPRAQRQELIEHISEYIAESRAAAASSGEDATVALRNALERLGEPGDIAAAAGGSVPAGRAGGLEITAVVLLLLGGILGLVASIPGLLVGWGIGVILMWVSPRWGWPDKLLGTLVWPGGLAGVVILLTWPASVRTCSGSGAAAVCSGGSTPTLWLSIPLVIALAVGPIIAATRLVIRARRVPDPGEAAVAGLAAR
jgi:hypothetical protein